jgi:hypothetical protein
VCQLKVIELQNEVVGAFVDDDVVVVDGITLLVLVLNVDVDVNVVG